MQLLLLPYTVLLIAVISSWKRRDVATGAYFLVAVGLAFYTQILELAGFAGLALTFAGGFIYSSERFPLWARRLGGTLAFIIAVMLMTHLWPGFNNALVLNQVQFSEKSAPFKMYMNFDKVCAGLILFYFLVRGPNKLLFKLRDLKTVGLTWLALVFAITPIGLAIGYIAMDVKWPTQSLIWMINNFFFVCFAEEVLFRGVIQDKLSQLRYKNLPPHLVALVVSSLLFGLAHYKGGIAYIALSTFAGLFYGFAFYRAQKLLASICVHFSLNLFHFVFLTYPYLQR